MINSMKVSYTDRELRYAPGTSSKDVLWLGAGFSTCVSSGELPLTSSFFDRLEHFHAPALFCFLKEWYGNPRKANVEEALTALDQLETAPVSAARCKDKLGADTGPRARRELGHYSMMRLSRWCADPRHWAYRMLLAVDQHTTVVTTNYDMCAESILGTRADLKHASASVEPDCHNCKTQAILGYDCECGPRTISAPASGDGAILKLHGSISWRTCRNPECAVRDCIAPSRDACNIKCSCCKGATEPVLVLPAMAKSYNLFPHLQRMWDNALGAIERAERLLIFGFSFPSSDAAISRLFRSAILASRSLREILVMDAAPQPVVHRLRQMLGDRSTPSVHELVVPVDGSEPVWWKQGHGRLDIQDFQTVTTIELPTSTGARESHSARSVKRVVRWLEGDRMPSAIAPKPV